MKSILVLIGENIHDYDIRLWNLELEAAFFTQVECENVAEENVDLNDTSPLELR